MLANLRALFVRLIDIVQLRGGPEQLPASAGLLGVVVALSVGVATLVNSLIPNSIDDWQTRLLVEPVVALVAIRAAFTLAGKPERFLQTSIALFGTALLFLPVLIPMQATLLPYIEKPDPAVPPPAALTLLAAVVGTWAVIVQVRILRAAFEWHWIAALIFYFALNIATALIYGMLFGFPSKVV